MHARRMLNVHVWRALSATRILAKPRPVAGLTPLQGDQMRIICVSGGLGVWVFYHPIFSRRQGLPPFGMSCAHRPGSRRTGWIEGHSRRVFFCSHLPFCGVCPHFFLREKGSTAHFVVEFSSRTLFSPEIVAFRSMDRYDMI